MPVQVSLDDLMAYTGWEREQWHAWFRQHGARALGVGVGPHGDGRFETVGDLVRHIFSAEARYIDRLTGRPLTDPASIPRDEVEALFDFGRGSRERLRAFQATLPAGDWDAPQELALGQRTLTVTPRKIVLHILLHEAKHWAQVATLLRLQGMTADFHDLIFSPVLSGEAPPHQDSA
jgi:uncharacterized damage-inducible protein DinB